MENISRFISFFREQLGSISAICLSAPGDLLIFKKILYVSMVDTLSKAAYPQLGSRNNRERFVTFIKNFVNWKYSEKISLPHLTVILENTSDPGFSQLRQLANYQFNRWVQGEIIGLDKDPDYSDVNDLWPRDKNGKPKPIKVHGKQIRIDLLTHGSMFYSYRNTLIHEMRKPGYGVDWEKKVEPYYVSMDHLDDMGRMKGTSWELVYPINFLALLCENALEQLEKFYRKNQIDPYSLFTYGTYWIEELNR